MTSGPLKGVSNRRVQQRILGKFGNERRGPRMIVVAGIHGNEPSGIEAASRVLAALREQQPAAKGSVYFVAGNLTALASSSRFVHLDLNRQWTEDRIAAALSTADQPGDPAEHRELRELLQTLEAVVSDAPGQLYFVDLHTSSAPGSPFLTVGDTLRNRAFAQQLPLPLILGLEEQVDGALLELLNNYGFVTMGVEGGKHDSPTSADIHEAVLWLALAASGVIPRDAVPDPGRLGRLLEKSSEGMPSVVEVRRRHAIVDDDGFQMAQGYRSFQPVAAGEIVASDRNGPVRVPEDGLILLPLYQGQGDDGFFVAREVRVFWLRVSRLFRKLRLSGLLRLLPGVRRDPDRPDIYVVDTRIARWYSLEIFHLFGFRKLRKTGDDLLVSRRRYDLSPPRRVVFSGLSSQTPGGCESV